MSRRCRRARAVAPGLFAEAFGRRVVHEPGSRWLYNRPDVELRGWVLRRATGLQADELAARALFGPPGITAWDWERGRSEGYPSLHLRPSLAFGDLLPRYLVPGVRKRSTATDG